MKKNRILFYFLGSFFFLTSVVNAQESNEGIRDYTPGILKSAAVGIEYQVKAGVAVGGMAPIPLAPQIREIKGYNPLLNISLEGNITKMFNDFGITSGLRLETKGMKTKARVKEYNIAMIAEDKGSLSGVFTGIVETEVSNSYLTLPVLAVWQASPRWRVKLGPYCSYLLSGDFSGETYDGYLREGEPTGEYIEISSATYDFSSDLRRWNWGAQLGGEWKAFPHLSVAFDLTWGFNSIFKKDFDTITFDMYPIYGTLSFGYIF